MMWDERPVWMKTHTTWPAGLETEKGSKSLISASSLSKASGVTEDVGMVILLSLPSSVQLFIYWGPNGDLK